MAEFGFIKLVGDSKQQTFDLWINFNDKIINMETEFRRQFPQITLPYEIGLQIFKETNKLYPETTLSNYGFRPGTEPTLHYQLFYRNNPTSTEKLYLPSFHKSDFHFIKVKRVNLPAVIVAKLVGLPVQSITNEATSTYWIDFNAKISNLNDHISKSDNVKYGNIKFNGYTLDMGKRLNDYRIKADSTLIAVPHPTQFSRH